MTVQLTIVCILVFAATLYVVRSTLRAIRSESSGCGGGCRCASKTPSFDASQPAITVIPASDLRIRARQPERCQEEFEKNF